MLNNIYFCDPIRVQSILRIYLVSFTFISITKQLLLPYKLPIRDNKDTLTLTLKQRQKACIPKVERRGTHWRHLNILFHPSTGWCWRFLQHLAQEWLCCWWCRYDPVPWIQKCSLVSARSLTGWLRRYGRSSQKSCRKSGKHLSLEQWRCLQKKKMQCLVSTLRLICCYTAMVEHGQTVKGDISTCSVIIGWYVHLTVILQYPWLCASVPV